MRVRGPLECVVEWRGVQQDGLPSRYAIATNPLHCQPLTPLPPIRLQFLPCVFRCECGGPGRRQPRLTHSHQQRTGEGLRFRVCVGTLNGNPKGVKPKGCGCRAPLYVASRFHNQPCIFTAIPTLSTGPSHIPRLPPNQCMPSWPSIYFPLPVSQYWGSRCAAKPPHLPACTGRPQVPARAFFAGPRLPC